MKTRYKLDQSRYSLSRELDRAGDSGPMLNAVWLDENEEVQTEPNVLEIGKACQCGSFLAGTYSTQDWWCTTPITEFLEVDEENSIFKFKTGNSVYNLRRIS